jgi:hypothetical protein
MSKLHFILGFGRSGTTLLSNELNKVSGVLAVPEMVFLIFFLQKFEKKSITHADLILIIEQIKVYGLSHPWVDWKFDEHQLIESYEKATIKGEVNYLQVCQIAYESFGNAYSPNDIHTVIDKNPSYTLFANRISKFSPSSKFVLLTRDYRANILSRKQSVYLKSGNLVYNAVRWTVFNKKALQFQKRNPEKVFLLSYEGFISDSDRNIQQISMFFQVEYVIKENKSLPGFQPDSFEIPDQFQHRYQKKYSDLSKPVNSSRKEAWKEQLSEKEIFLCDLFCGKTGAALGYEMVNKIPTSQKVLNHIKFFLPVCKAYVDVYKDYIIYYLHPKLKLKILKKKYKKIGFIKGK